MQHQEAFPIENDPAPRAARAFRTLSLSALGIEMGLSVAIGFLIGNWLDGKLDSYPYMTLLWIGFGIAAGFRAVLRVARAAKKSSQESNE